MTLHSQLCSSVPFDKENLPEEVCSVLKVFPEFQPQKFNDSGANGYVLIGFHNVLRKTVAIKIYFHCDTDIEQEPALVVRIDHPNVLKVYDARKISSECSYFMMHAAGEGDLFSFLSKYNLSLSFSHSLLCQVLSGISALHAKPNYLVHRDLKPENLLVHDDTILIADFGSVRQVSEETGKAPASRHSILYRPPESFGGNSYYDFSSDIYQAGLIGFMLFGGKISIYLEKYLTPSQRKKIAEIKSSKDQFEVSKFVDQCIQSKIEKGRLVDFSSLPFFVPRSIKTILRKAISTSNRYSSTCEFLADLNNIRASLPEWIMDGDSLVLNEWEGKDYFLCQEGSLYLVKKRKSGSVKFKKDNSFGRADTLESLYEIVKNKLGIK